jgi:hypothetical protein
MDEIKREEKRAVPIAIQVKGMQDASVVTKSSKKIHHHLKMNMPRRQQQQQQQKEFKTEKQVDCFIRFAPYISTSYL